MAYRYVHKNKCKGGIAVDEVNDKTYCYGRLDYETEEIDSQCKECPRLVHIHIPEKRVCDCPGCGARDRVDASAQHL